MTKETADRFYQYRKSIGMSQEELAAKIGVSRQAISKWERAESSPDTDNLIALAKLYNITIDELINGEAAEPVCSAASDTSAKSEETQEIPETEPSDTEKQEPHISFRDGIHVHDGKDKVDISFSGIHIESKNGESVHIGRDCGIQTDGIDERHIFKRGNHPALHALLPTLVITAYLIIGFMFDDGWKLGWLLIFLIPIIESFVTAIKTKNPSAFAYPVLVAAVYLTVGMFMSIWHPTWILFLTIPIYYIIADLFRPKKNKNTEKEL